MYLCVMFNDNSNVGGDNCGRHIFFEKGKKRRGKNIFPDIVIENEN